MPRGRRSAGGGSEEEKNKTRAERDREKEMYVAERGGRSVGG